MHAIILVLMLVIPLVSAPEVAGAASTDADKCTAAKLVASGDFVSCRLKAEAALVEAGDAAKFATAVARCSALLATAFQKADEKFGVQCVVVEPLANFQEFLSQCADQTAEAGSGGEFPSACGDGVITAEACDGADLGGKSCASLGLGTGTLACSDACGFDTSGCIPPFCGDGVVNAPGEQCDGADLDGETCTSLGHTGGTLGCAADCTIDVSGCSDLRCCQISIGSVNACLNVRLAEQCSSGGVPIPFTDTTFTLAPSGQVCDGASGLCAAVRSGPGSCCQIDGGGHHTCVEGNDPTGSTCDLVEAFSNLTSTPLLGYSCVPDPVFGFTCQP